jgi:hypothetical protein
MAQTGYTPIQLYYSATATNTPTSGNLINGELALNITDGKLFYKDNAGAVQVLAEKGGNGVTTFSAGTTGFTPNTATAGAITLAGTLATTNGGTGLTSFVANQIFFASSTSAIGQSANLTWTGTAFGVTGGVNITGTTAVTGAITATADSTFSSTGALKISSGTTGQQPVSPVEGMLRYNTTTKQFEGYSEVSSVPGWYSVGGSAISNDTTTNATRYPLFAASTSGTAQTVYTSSPNYQYNPLSGALQAEEMVASNGLIVNNATVTNSYTLPNGYNAVSVGPITMASGATVTVPSGQRWVIL